MTAEDFVKRLKDIKIDIENLRLRGISDSYIQSKIHRYLLIKRDDQTFNNPINELINNYESYNLTIGGIEFHDFVKTVRNFSYFATVEDCMLAIDSNTAKIVMVEPDEKQIIYSVAKSSEHFLSAIADTAQFLERRGTEDGLYEDEPENIRVAEKIGEIAGGVEYVDFYRYMFGV